MKFFLLILVSQFHFLVFESALASEARPPVDWTTPASEMVETQKPPEGPRHVLDFPVLEIPSGISPLGYFPSMQQSLDFSTNYYLAAHEAISKIKSEGFNWRQFGLIGFDVVSIYLPLGNAWLHEEWHRAVMARRGLSSHNDVYNFKFGASTIAVSHVTDQELANFKRKHPAEFVRMSAAGMEAESEQNFSIAKKTFSRWKYGQMNVFNEAVLLWLNQTQNLFYLWTCGTRSADRQTDEMNAEDGADVSVRDFTGLDCNAWVYDLFRPQEPYSARGIHPSGVGINRYIKASDLTDEEKKYLSRQKVMALLNFVDPFLLARISYPGSFFERNFYWNANLRHLLTSFGTVTDLNLFLKLSSRSWVATLHGYQNKNSLWPGLEFAEIPSADSDPREGDVGNSAAMLSTSRARWFPRAAIWWQPQEQSFYSSQPELGDS